MFHNQLTPFFIRRRTCAMLGIKWLLWLISSGIENESSLDGSEISGLRRHLHSQHRYCSHGCNGYGV